MGYAFALHILFAVIWVGGMFFAYVCLRPSVGALDTSARAQLWAQVLGRFFVWVLIAVPTMLASGLYMAQVEGGLAEAGPRIHIMLGLGVLMMLLFFHVYFVPFRRLKRAVAENDAGLAGKALAQIRVLVAVNLWLGLLVVLDASGGKYFLG